MPEQSFGIGFKDKRKKKTLYIKSIWSIFNKYTANKRPDYNLYASFNIAVVELLLLSSFHFWFRIYFKNILDGNFIPSQLEVHNWYFVKKICDWEKIAVIFICQSFHLLS